MSKLKSRWKWIAVIAWMVWIFSCGVQCSSSSSEPEAATDPGGNPQGPTEDPPLTGNAFYVDPATGDMDNDGSAGAPWRTLQEVIENDLIQTRAYDNLPYDGANPFRTVNPDAPVKPGDTIFLLSGFHGEINLRGAHNTEPIAIRAASGHQPELSRVFLSSASNWRLQNLTISPSFAPTYETRTLVHIESHGFHGPSRQVTVEGCRLYSVEDSSGWSMGDWNNLACNGIQASGDGMTVRNNTCKNVNFGITISGNDALVSDNLIENFAGDGMRGLGNDLVFEYNTVKNCYDVNGNHDDGFQSWSINDDPPRERVVLRGNIFINYEDPNQPFKGTLQGIGCFDGPYVDWVVENNLVLVDHWHGISLYGAINSRIVNNTVADLNSDSPGPPWIRINPHKDGTPSEDCAIRNNIAPSIVATGNTVEDHNYLLDGTETFFVDPANHDYHLTADAHPLIDAGGTSQAPSEDMDGHPRPQGSGIDLGCYEY